MRWGTFEKHQEQRPTFSWLSRAVGWNGLQMEIPVARLCEGFLAED
jgi:hypothetical protein